MSAFLVGAAMFFAPQPPPIPMPEGATLPTPTVTPSRSLPPVPQLSPPGSEGGYPPQGGGPIPTHGGPDLGSSQFGTGAFPFGATMVVAGPDGQLSIETIVTKTVMETHVRKVPFEGPDGRTMYRDEQYAATKPVFMLQKRTLPAETKIYRNGRELSFEEKRGLYQPTPIFISMMGSQNSAPGQGYERILGDALVAFVPSGGMAMPGGAAPMPVPSAVGMAPPAGAPTARMQPSGGPPATMRPGMPPMPRPMVVRVSRVDPATGTIVYQVKETYTVMETKTEMRQESRTVQEGGEVRQVTVNVPATVQVPTQREATKEVPWSSANGMAFDMNGQPIAPAGNALQRVQVGDVIVVAFGQVAPDTFGNPAYSGAKLALVNRGPGMSANGAPPMATNGSGAPNSPPGRPTPGPTVPSADVSAAEKDVIEKSNAARAEAGLPPLKVDPTLMRSAREHSANMARIGRLEHVIDGKGPPERLADLGMRPFATGENCAQGQNSAADAMSSWMNSPGHKGNILGSQFTHIGVGRADGPSGPYWTQVFARTEQ